MTHAQSEEWDYVCDNDGLYVTMHTHTIMKTMVMSVLLCFLTALLEVHSQTIPYVTFMGIVLPNYSYIKHAWVGKDGSDSVQWLNDLITCCSSSQGASCGDLYSNVPNVKRLKAGWRLGISQTCKAQWIDLHCHRTKIPHVPTGIYHCLIETKNYKWKTLYVGHWRVSTLLQTF